MSVGLFMAPCTCYLYPSIQAIGKGALSAFVLLGRSCLFIIICQLVFCMASGDYMGVFRAYPIAEAISAVFSIIVFFCLRKDLQGKQELPKK